MRSEDRRSRLEVLRQEWLWRKCKRDEEFCLRNFWSIQVPGHGKMLFPLRPAQVHGLHHWNDHRYSLTLKARQIGWTTLVAAHVWYVTFFWPDREVILISRTEEHAKRLLAKVKYGYKDLPEWLRRRGPQLLDDNKQWMTFSNGSSIVSMPSAQDPARGSSAFLIVVDEWAFLPNGEEAWGSIEPVADIGGRIIGLSTANGWGEFFHSLWVEAEVGNNYFKTMFHPWWAVSERDDDWYEMKRRTMLSWQLAQEYPNNPEEAFIKSGNPVFDIEMLLKLSERTATPRVGVLAEVA